MPKDGYATDIGVGGTRTATASPALSRSGAGRSCPASRSTGSIGAASKPWTSTPSARPFRSSMRRTGMPPSWQGVALVFARRMLV